MHVLASQASDSDRKSLRYCFARLGGGLLRSNPPRLFPIPRLYAWYEKLSPCIATAVKVDGISHCARLRKGIEEAKNRSGF